MFLHLETNWGLKESRREPEGRALFLLELGLFIEILLLSFCYAGVYDFGHQKEICLPEFYLLEVGESTFKSCVMYWRNSKVRLSQSSVSSSWLKGTRNLGSTVLLSLFRFLNLLLLHFSIQVAISVLPLSQLLPDYPGMFFIFFFFYGYSFKKY